MSIANPQPYFGRAWKIEVVTQAGETVTLSDSKWEPEGLRVTFFVEQLANRAFWTADVSVFNLNSATEQYVIRQGDEVTILAGYQSSFDPSGATPPQSKIKDPLGNQLPSAQAIESQSLIFRGKVYQPLWERRDVTDFILTLRCILGIKEIVQNFISFSQSAFATQLEIVNRMAKDAHTQIQQEYVDTAALSSKKYPRGKAVFGNPGDIFDGIARDNQMLHWLSPNGLNIRTLDAENETPDFVFGPSLPNNITVHSDQPYTPTLIGTPQQTQGGVVFRVLMDSRLKLASMVKLDMSVIRQLPRTYRSYPGILDHDGMYVVAGMRHVGDTRGNEWYTDVTALSRDIVTKKQSPLLYRGY